MCWRLQHHASFSTQVFKQTLCASAQSAFVSTDSPGGGKRHRAGMHLREVTLGTQALLVELLLSGFFAIACFRARAVTAQSFHIAPRTLFAMTDRLERLRRSRWQWFSMVLLLVFVRMERGAPMIAELTVLAQLAVFLILPSQTPTAEAVRAR
jgi:hypothetical protein